MILCFLFSRSLCLFLELWESPRRDETDEEHVQTYLWLGRSYKDRGRSQNIRACYEMGLLIALHARNLHSKSEFNHKQHSDLTWCGFSSSCYLWLLLICLFVCFLRVTLCYFELLPLTIENNAFGVCRWKWRMYLLDYKAEGLEQNAFGYPGLDTGDRIS